MESDRGVLIESICALLYANDEKSTVNMYWLKDRRVNEFLRALLWNPNGDNLNSRESADTVKLNEGP